MTPEPVPRMRITEPADVAQIMPYLVGFTPENSLVVSALLEGQVQVTARVDLPDVQPNGGVEALLDRIWARFPGASAVAVAYTDDHLAGWDVLSRTDARLPFGAITMLIDNDTWHTPDGTSGPVDPTGRTATQAADFGLRRLPSRADLEARFASPPDTDDLDRQLGEGLAALPPRDDTTAIVQHTSRLIDANLPTGDTPKPISVQEAVQLAVLAQHPAARELALLRIDRDSADQHLALWQDVVRHSPANGSDMALFVAGMAAWISGEGASATIALERSLAAEPPFAGRHPAQLLEGIIDNVVNPRTWDTLRRDLTEHAHPAVRAALATSPGHSPRAGWPPTPHTVPRGPEPGHRRPPSPGIRRRP